VAGSQCHLWLNYKDWKTEYTDIFDTYKSDKAWEEDVGVSRFGLAIQKGEGAPVTYDTQMQGFITRYTHAEYALGFVITRNMVEDDQYGKIGSQRAKALARSMRQTKETLVPTYLTVRSTPPTWWRW
jgi:hypothetical protein